MGKKQLIIAEKPKVAASIAQAIGGMTRKTGYYEGPNHFVSWAFGHLIELCDAADYNPDWKEWRLEDLPILPQPFRRRISKRRGVKQQFEVLKALMHHAEVTEVVNACDAGREGELIFRSIYKFARCTLPVKRLWISSQTKDAILEGMKNLRPGSEFDTLGDEAVSRQEADWLIGINGTRAYSAKNNARVVIGRVQTPTLALIVQRELAIRNFTPEPYYRIKVLFETDEGEGYVGWWFKDDQKSLDKKDDAERIASAISDQAGVVISVESQEKEQAPPLLFDLTSLQQYMNKHHGFSAAKTLDIAQELYETHKVLTYPRTDSRYLSGDLIPRLGSAIRACAVVMPTETQYVADLPQLPITGRIVNDKKVTDHHAIIPTGQKPDLSKMSDDEKLVFEEVVRRFLAVFYPPYRYKETVVITEVAGETFRTRGAEVLDMGWHTLYPPKQSQSQDDEDLDLIPELRQNDTVMIMDTEVVERMTKPPARYTEASLLYDMERIGKFLDDDKLQQAVKARGLGTPATRADIIEKLLKSGYIYRKGRALIPSDVGIALIEGLNYEVLKSPELTAEWEIKMGQIRSGEITRDEFMQGIRTMTQDLIQHVRQSGIIPGIHGIRDADSDEAIGSCPLCKMPVRQYKKAYTCGNRACSFFIMRFIASKAITPQIVKSLLDNGETGYLKGFKSKSGKPFNARLRLNAEGRAEFVFDKNDA